MPEPRIIQLIPAASGWWAELRFRDEPNWLMPIAAWALLEITDTYGTDRTMVGVDPTGEGWSGELLHESAQLVQYLYDPRPETAATYVSRYRQRVQVDGLWKYTDEIADEGPSQ